MRYRRGRRTGTGHGQWKSPIPRQCNLCKGGLSTAFIDGKTRLSSEMRGTWAIMCPPCFAVHGIGLGTGKGQLYDMTGRKVEG